jgi:RNA-directed DNA polymerase
MEQETVSAVPEQAQQGTEAGERKLWWVEASIWTERMVSALENGVKGGKWFSLVDKLTRPATLEAAWRKVARNKGAAGVDGQSTERFAVGAERYLRELQISLEVASYRAQPVKRVEIPKGDGKTRPLGIPAVKDRVVQTALKMVIEPIPRVRPQGGPRTSFEVQFRACSYGFRPGRHCKGALREVDGLVKDGYTWVVDADLASYFDTIPHERLMTLVEGSISDGRVLGLIEAFLRQDIMNGMERWQPTSGTPQGAVISPLLANLYLHPLDVLMERSERRMVRYADDFVILCRTQAEAEAALREVQAWVAENGLTLHPDKTRIGDCRQAGQGFEFLGYRFEAGRRLVRKKSLKALRDRVRSRTIRSRGDSLGRIIGDINPTLRGWYGYFQHAAPGVFRAIDGFVRRRLRAILRKQEKRPGFGRCKADHQRWPNAFFAAHGLFTLQTAQASARHCR